MEQQLPSNKGKKSLISLIGIVVVLLLIRLANPRWDTHNVLAILSWDVLGYYLWLPSAFIYQDLTELAFVPEILKTYRPTGGFYQAFELENGKFVMKYTMGLSILYLPFFLLGDLAAVLLGYPRDGFSEPYQVAIGLSGVGYALLGLAILRKVLLRYFKDAAVALALVIMVFGSNYLQYVSIDGAMPHGYLFTMYALVIWLSIRWHATYLKRYAILLGLVIGVSALARPTEILLVLIPLFWGIGNGRGLKERLFLLWEKKEHFMLAGLGVFLVVLPQLIYWKYVTGDFIYYTYEDQKFDWLTPHFKDVLWGGAKGWLLYTPLMGLPVLGFYFLYKRQFKLFVPLALYWFINLYVVCSWSVWWYQGSISCRALVQSYAILLFPLAALLGWASRQRIRTIIVGGLLLVLLPMNLFLLWQYNEGLIPPNGASRAYYFRILGKTSVTKADYLLIDTRDRIDYESDYKTSVLYNNDFETDSTQAYLSTERSLSGNNSYRSTQESNYKNLIKLKRSELPKEGYLRLESKFWGKWHNVKLVTSTQIPGVEKTRKWTAVRLNGPVYKNGEWDSIAYDYELIPQKHPDEEVVIYMLNSGNAVYLDDFKLTLFSRD